MFQKNTLPGQKGSSALKTEAINSCLRYPRRQENWCPPPWEFKIWRIFDSHSRQNYSFMNTAHNHSLLYWMDMCKFTGIMNQTFVRACGGVGLWRTAHSSDNKNQKPWWRQSEDSSLGFLKRHFHTNTELFSMSKNVQNCDKSSRKF